MEEASIKDYFHEANFLGQDGSLHTLRIPVVQELARHGIKDLPPNFIRSSSDHYSSRASCDSDALKTFPSISMAKLRGISESEGRAVELSKLASGARQWGMLLLTDHGIACSVLDGVKDAVKGFFGLSFEEKKKSVGSYSSVDNMGYGRNFVKSADQPLDWIDRLTMKAAPKGATDGLNVWPQRPANFRQVMENYAEEARKVCDELLHALAESLSLERRAFSQFLEPNESEISVRVNYYPPCPRPELAMGITPHSDPSTLSLLMQFDVSEGLQVMLKENQWLNVPWPNDALLVIVGDLLEIMSNGITKSAWHRAVTQMSVERYSVALFYTPPSRFEIGPVCGGDGSKEEYKNVVVGDYLQHYYKISPTTSKQAIMFAKV